MMWSWAIMMKSKDRLSKKGGVCAMNFKPLSFYLIDYGTHTKIATFTNKEKNINYFFDIDGKFSLSDEFLKKGTITITEIEDDEEGIF